MAAVGGNLTGCAFTNPKVVHWLVRQTKVPFGALTQELAISPKRAEVADRGSADSGGVEPDFGGMDWRPLGQTGPPNWTTKR